MEGYNNLTFAIQIESIEIRRQNVSIQSNLLFN